MTVSRQAGAHLACQLQVCLEDRPSVDVTEGCTDGDWRHSDHQLRPAGRVSKQHTGMPKRRRTEDSLRCEPGQAVEFLPSVPRLVLPPQSTAHRHLVSVPHQAQAAHRHPPGFLLVNPKHAAARHAGCASDAHRPRAQLPRVVPVSRHALPKQLLSMLPGQHQQPLRWGCVRSCAVARGGGVAAADGVCSQQNKLTRSSFRIDRAP